MRGTCMSQNERIYKIDQLLNNHQVVPIATFLERLEVSLATFKRDIAYMRDRLNAPIEFNRELGGYQLGTQRHHGERYELPGLWFAPEEIHALITMQQLLQNLDGSGMLSGHVQPLLSRLKMVIDDKSSIGDDFEHRIKVKNVGYRNIKMEYFPLIATATLQQKRMMIVYRARSTDEEMQREISPQRVNYYKGNWYLEAWCHVRNGMRIFSIDCIMQVEVLNEACHVVSIEELEESERGYGIFSSKEIQWAKLKFSPKASRWITAEIWHPNQKQAIMEDGSLLLEVPYSDETEMVMDILRHGDNVKVLHPECLVESIKSVLRKALNFYLCFSSSVAT